MQDKKSLKIKVNIRAFTFADSVAEDSPIVARAREYVRTKDRAILSELKKSGALIAYRAKHNIVVTAGRNVIARRLAGNVGYTGAINYGALGTQVNPVPNNASTQLGVEVYRKTAASLAFDTNIAYIDFFYSASDTNGTYTEFGNFIDGAAGANTGQLFSYIATGGWVKTNAQSLFISCQYTIN